MTTETRDLAHIVYPAARLHRVLDGTTTRCRALCGKYVSRPSKPAEDVCRECFDLWYPVEVERAAEVAVG